MSKPADPRGKRTVAKEPLSVARGLGPRELFDSAGISGVEVEKPKLRVTLGEFHWFFSSRDQSLNGLLKDWNQMY